MLRVEPARVNLRAIARLDEIYAAVRERRLSPAGAIAELERSDVPPLRVPMQIVATAAVALGVALILGGGIREQAVAAAIGATTGVIAAFAERNRIIDRLFEVIAGFLATLIVAGSRFLLGPTNIYISVFAGIVVLLPGYSLTLALHELANRDLVAGTARLGKVLSTLLALGCGALLGVAVTGPALFAGIARPQPVASWVLVPAAVLMGLGEAVTLQARRRDVAWVLAACAVAITAEHLFSRPPFHAVEAFLSALLCGSVANLGARFARVPQPVVLVPALIVLVPGSLSYESVLLAFHHQLADAMTIAVNTVSATVQIVAGLLLTQLLFPEAPLRAVRDRR
jgi:uncharacterized membrane protein YjjP (DUF1212 family)